MALEEELHAIDAMAFVNSAKTFGKVTDKLNSIGVVAYLSAEITGLPKKQRRRIVHCSADMPTQLHCAQQLRTILTRDFSHLLLRNSFDEPSRGESNQNVFGKMHVCTMSLPQNTLTLLSNV